MSCNSSGIVQQFFCNLYDASIRRATSFLIKLILIREGELQLHNYDSRLLSRNEIDYIIAHICTFQHVIAIFLIFDLYPFLCFVPRVRFTIINKR
jgi:hypothetical protein